MQNKIKIIGNSIKHKVLEFLKITLKCKTCHYLRQQKFSAPFKLNKKGPSVYER